MSSKGITGFNAGLVKSASSEYVPTEWATGDVITADKLNHIEDGIEQAISFPVVTFTSKNGSYVCDKTYQELTDLVTNVSQTFMVKLIYDGQGEAVPLLYIAAPVYDNNQIAGISLQWLSVGITFSNGDIATTTLTGHVYIIFSDNSITTRNIIVPYPTQ